MRKILVYVLAMVLLAFAVPMAVMPAAAQGVLVPGDDDGNKIVSEEELAGVILSYMLEEPEHLGLDKVREIAHIHVYYPMTITDSLSRTVTIYKPVERVVVLHSTGVEAIIVLGAEEKIVGVTEDNILRKLYLRERLKHAESIGTFSSPSVEKIIVLNPDVVILHEPHHAGPGNLGEILEEKLTPFGINVFYTVLREPDKLPGEMETLGTIFDKEDKAQEFIAMYQKYMDIIEDRVKDLSEDKKPRVYIEHLDYRPFIRHVSLIEMAGGKFIVPKEEIKLVPTEVDAEWVVSKNPEIVIKELMGAQAPPDAGWGASDVPEQMEKIYNEVISRPGWKGVDAVGNNRVYLIHDELYNTPRVWIAVIHMAKWFHPELFEDLDPDAIHAEYAKEFLGLEYKGVWIYSTE